MKKSEVKKQRKVKVKEFRKQLERSYTAYPVIPKKRKSLSDLLDELYADADAKL